MRAMVTTNQGLDAEPDRFVPGQLTASGRDFNLLANPPGGSITDPTAYPVCAGMRSLRVGAEDPPCVAFGHARLEDGFSNRA